MKLNSNILFFASLLLFTYLITSFFTGKRGYREIVKLNKRRNLIKREILVLGEKNRLLRERIYMIRHDPVYIEKIAREELGMVRAGEKVYKFKVSGK